MLTGCFTGVESTPLIKAPDSSDSRRSVRPEDTFLADIVPEPLSQWRPGKVFDIVDDRFTMLLGNTAPSGPMAGRSVRYAGASETVTPAGTGATGLKFVMDSSPSDTLVYTIDRPLSELMEQQRLDVHFAVQRSVVDSAASRLLGNVYYLTSRVWRDSTDAVVTGRKFIPVTVSAVAPGNADYPLRVDFTTADGRSPSGGLLFLTPGERYDAPRTFGAFFSFTDPRLDSPGIPDEIWERIVTGTVAPGMNREQVRLSLGAPRDIQRRTGNGAYIMREVWVYSSGRIVVFEDGILVDD